MSASAFGFVVSIRFLDSGLKVACLGFGVLRFNGNGFPKETSLFTTAGLQSFEFWV